MPISCQDILELAEAYVSNCESECKRRNVIGRAYYAVYHRADLFHRSLPQPGLAAPDGGKHKQLWYALTNPTVNDNKIKMTSRKIGYLCKDLHAKRVDADYLLHESVDFDDVTQALTQARTVFKLTE